MNLTTIEAFSAAALVLDCLCACWLCFLVYSVTHNLEGTHVGKFRALALAFAAMGVASKVCLTFADFFGGVASEIFGSGVVYLSEPALREQIAMRFAAGHLSSAVILVSLALFVRASFRAHDVTVGHQRERLLRAFLAGKH